jgi:hypothetical protein
MKKLLITVKQYKFYARRNVYRRLLFLTGVFLNLLDPLNKKEIVFPFCPICFHILHATVESAKDLRSSVDFHLSYVTYSAFSFDIS